MADSQQKAHFLTKIIEEKIMKKYVSYEEGSEGKFTEQEMEDLYNEVVDKEEYADYEDWKWDVLRSGVFEHVR